MSKGCDFIYLLNSPRPLYIDNPNFINQLEKLESQTQCYFHISVSYDRTNPTDFTAYFIGFIPKSEVKKYGERFAAGSLRPNDSGRQVLFSRETYEVMFGDFISPPIPTNYESIPQFQAIYLSQTHKYTQRRMRLDNSFPR